MSVDSGQRLLLSRGFLWLQSIRIGCKGQSQKVTGRLLGVSAAAAVGSGEGEERKITTSKRICLKMEIGCD